MNLATEQGAKIGYSVREAAAAISIGRSTLWRHIASGRVKTAKIGGRTIVCADSLRQFVQAQGN